jgi:hypothetical protein
MEITLQRITNSKHLFCKRCNREKKNGLRLLLNDEGFDDFEEVGFICTDCFKEEPIYTFEVGLPPDAEASGIQPDADKSQLPCPKGQTLDTEGQGKA